MKKNSYLASSLSHDDEKVIANRGKNIIPPPEKEPLWKAYLEKFKDPIIIVLLVVFAFSVFVALYEVFEMDKALSLLLEPMGILTALLLATGVGFIFEVKASREFDILNKVKDADLVKVIRRKEAQSAPRMMKIEKQDVVVDDLVSLESGDEVPADGYLLQATTLRVDESNFTGEIYTRKTTHEPDFQPDATYPSNFLLRGATIIEGNALYRVSAVGMDTEEGRGVARTQEGSDVKTPLNKQLDELGKWISIISFVLAALIVIGRMVYFFFFDGNATNNSSFLEIIEFVLTSIMLAVTLIVVAVPEGLPMSITVSLALSMRRMLKENNLVRKLHACETMGAATVICTDKTGTLTKNQMTVMETDFYTHKADELIALSIAVNSTAELTHEEQAHLQAIGNPTEGALLAWLHKQGIAYAPYRERATITAQKLFSTETKYMETTIAEGEEGGELRLIKGAPEILLAMADKIAEGHTPEQVHATLHHYQQRAMRTLGFAYQRITPKGDQPIIFMGIVGIADPIRDDVQEAIETCRNRAGVRVIIVTGDTPGTANEIGRQIGLLAPDEAPQTVTGIEFAALTDEQARELLRNPNFKIISRARPDDKARLVTLLQANGEVVAVTGDGTNDAPALSKAQVGLSMGDGTARAKEASNITILDNSFSSINKAIMWGRSLYLNIRRFIIFQMTINVCACLIVLLGAFIGLDSPLTVTQMLWVNLIMDTFAAMALSSLPADKGVLDDKPRRPNSHIIDRKMAKRILGVGLLFFLSLAGFWQLLWHKEIQSVAELINWESAQLFFTDFLNFEKVKPHMSSYEMGVFFSVFVMLQFWNLFNAKYFRTKGSLIQDLIDLFRNPQRVKESYSKGFILITLAILLGQLLIVNYASQMFSVSPLSLQDWGWILLLTSPVLWLADITRYLHQRSNKSNIA